MEIVGLVHRVNATQVVSDKFKKREIIIKTEASSPYPQYLLCQVTQDKCDMLNSFNEGEEVKAQINLKGRLWDGGQGEKCFNTIEIWRIEKMQGSAPSHNNTQNSDKPSPHSNIVESDDLPF